MEAQKIEQVLIIFRLLVEHYKMRQSDAIALMGDGHVLTGWEVEEHPGFIAETLITCDEMIQEAEHERDAWRRKHVGNDRA